jgi:Leucine-rich repeat (LRR) protein
MLFRGCFRSVRQICAKLRSTANIATLEILDVSDNNISLLPEELAKLQMLVELRAGMPFPAHPV